MSHYRRICSSITILLITFLLAACGGSNTPQAQKPTPTPSPTPGQGVQLLRTASQKITTARTLHGIFNVKITGQALNGFVNSEVWNVPPDKNRTEVRQSSVSQFSTGSVTVSNGKQLWQYDPVKKVVYTGPISSTTGTPTTGSNSGINGNGGQNQFILNIIQSVFTRSDATLASSSTKINGHDTYDVHVTSKEQGTGTPGTSGTSGTSGAGGTGSNRGGIANLSYDGDVYIDKTTTLPLQINLKIQGFGQVLLDLPTLVLNQPIPDSTFTFVVPRGVKVLPLQQTSSTPTTGSLTLDQAQQQAGYHLLSIPSTQTDYQLQGVNALGAPGSQIYTLNYTKGNISFTIAEGKPLANLPSSGGQQISLRGTTATLSTTNGSTTLAWTENAVGITITGPLTKDQIVSIARLLA